MSVKCDLPSKSGVVDKVRILQSSSGWEANFTLKGNSSTIYSQSYTTASKIFLVFPLVFKVVGYTIHPGDTITFYVDKIKKESISRPLDSQPYGTLLRVKELSIQRG